MTISDKNNSQRKHHRFAAIDVGSNAIRMVISDWDGHHFEAIHKYRFPIRLGAEVFEKGRISAKVLKSSARTFQKFAQVAQKYDTEIIRAIGTSALREAKNQAAFIELIRRKSGIIIEVVSGIKEAGLIYRAVQKEVGLKGQRALLIDIGGGSMELTFVENGRPTATQSFPFGTVRTLEIMKKRKLVESQIGLVIGEYIKPLSEFIHNNQMTGPLDFAVGTGGNFETLGKLKTSIVGKISRSEISDVELDLIIQYLKITPMKDRIEKLELRPDRADVVIPAAMVIQAVLKQASVHQLLIPGVGLKDGILWSLVEKKKPLKPSSDAEATSALPSRSKSPKSFQSRDR